MLEQSLLIRLSGVLMAGMMMFPLTGSAQKEVHDWGDSCGGITPPGCQGETIHTSAISQYYDSNWWKEHSVWHGLHLTEGLKAEITVKIMTSDPSGASMYCHVLTAEEYQYYKVGNRYPAFSSFKNHSVCSIGKGGDGATWSFKISSGVVTSAWTSYSETGLYGHFRLTGEGREVDFGSEDEMIYVILSPAGGRNTYTVGYSISCKVMPKEDDGTYYVVYMRGLYGGGILSRYTKKLKDTPLTLADEIFTRSGYVQTGWSMAEDGRMKAYNLGESYTKDASIRLYPYWTAIESGKCIVTFNANGGSVSALPRQVTNGETVGILPTAMREGYDFVGWFTAATGGSKVTSDTVVKSAVTYYAQWREIPDPGTICLVSPYPLEAKAGTTVRFWFSRVDGSDGSIAVKVKTQTSTALIGTGPENGDLLYVKQILEWADGDTSDKYIDVPIYTTGVGKQFRFKLATMATGTYDGNVVPALEEAKIYVPIVGATPGMISLTQPNPLAAHENTTCRVWFSRIGGSDGSIAVKVKSQTSTATLRSDPTPWGQVGYVKKILEWGPGDTSDRYIDVPIYSNGAGLMFRLKLATMATGVYQGNLVPKLEEAKIYVPIVK